MFWMTGVPTSQSYRDLNMCLLASCVKRYIQGNGKMWKTIIDAKYGSTPYVCCTDFEGTSKLWKRRALDS